MEIFQLLSSLGLCIRGKAEKLRLTGIVPMELGAVTSSKDTSLFRRYISKNIDSKA